MVKENNMQSKSIRFDKLTVLLSTGQQKTLSLKSWVLPPAALDFFGAMFYIGFFVISMIYLFSGSENELVYFSMPLLFVVGCRLYEFKLRKKMEDFCFDWQEKRIDVTEWRKNLTGPVNAELRKVLMLSITMLVVICVAFTAAKLDEQVTTPLLIWLIPLILVLRSVALKKHSALLSEINDKNSSIVQVR